MVHALRFLRPPVNPDNAAREVTEIKRRLWISHTVRYSLQIVLFVEIWFEAQRPYRLAASAALAFCFFGEFRYWKVRECKYFHELIRESISVALALAVTTRALAAWVAFWFVRDLTNHSSIWFPIFNLAVCFGLVKQWLTIESDIRRWTRAMNEIIGVAPSAVSPPPLAEFILYIALSRREREPLLGDLSEDFATNVLPKFGRIGAHCWYWYKAILYAWIYACDNAIEPLIRRVIEPLWRLVVLPFLKWIFAPAFVLHKLGWADAIRALIERFIGRS